MRNDVMNNDVRIFLVEKLGLSIVQRVGMEYFLRLAHYISSYAKGSWNEKSFRYTRRFHDSQRNKI